MDNIFDIVDTNAVTIPEDVNYVDQLVGDGKKFKDISALARGKAESDAYIAALRKQLEEQNKELSTRMTLEKFLEAQKTGRSDERPVTPPAPGSDDQRVLDEATLLSKMEELLSRRDAQKTQETNLERTKRVLFENHGDRYAEVVNHKAQELNMTGAELTALAAKSPAAFFQLVGVSEGERPLQGAVIPRNGMNTIAQPSGAGVRDQKYYERMKQTDPVRYASGQVTSEMMRDMAALGRERFYAK